MTFQIDGIFQIVADCNNAGGSFTDESGALTLEIFQSTLALCPDDSRGEQFIELLHRTARYFFQDSHLFIDLMADGGTLEFAPAEEKTEMEDTAESVSEEAPVFGNGIIWNWVSYNSPHGELVVDEDALYTLSLDDEGTLILGAPCRIAVGAYLQDENSLAFTYDIPEKFDENCEEHEYAASYFELLQSAALFFTEDGQLFIDLFADGGTLAFNLWRTVDIGEAESDRPVTVVDLCGEEALNLNEIEATLAPDVIATLDDLITSFISQGSVFDSAAPGVSLLVITPIGHYYKSAGIADVTSCEPLMADSLFEIGSNTKMMTAAMIFQLQEEGVLSTSDLISDWIPDVAALVPNNDQITIEMLLTHTNGIYDYINGVAEDGPLAASITDKAIRTQLFTPEELVALAVDSGEPYFEPGAQGQWTYSNTGYILLGLIIEEATGQTYEDNLQERIFEPLGLENAFLLTGQPDPGQLPPGYFDTPFDEDVSDWDGSQAWSAGAVIATAEELAVFMKALFSGDLFQDAATLDLMLEPAQPDFEGFSDDFYYGHGMFYKQGLLGHGGQALGYLSDGGYVPDSDTTIVIWANSANNAVGQAGVEIANIIGAISSE